ncbi:MAG TPA: glycosyltransferase family 39 protein [Terriglobales bacterium]|jgi:4-amino-4-deoxy-L-arabinose transferase-like glycosyltransferase|nr:glycosyltransferase family 39 protein [Terriglobales bacterium]
MAQVSSPEAQNTASFLGWWSGARTSFFWMFAGAFALRFGYILIARTYHIKGLEDNFAFGWEMGRIGRAIANGRGFADPFGLPTGPTAWEPPLYPYLIAAVFRLAGVYTNASALVLLTINSVFSALTCIPIFFTARKCFGEKVAIWTAWMWAVLPFVMFYSTRWIWETSLAAFLLTVLFSLTLRLEEAEGLLPWVMFGVLWGLAALTNPSLLAFLPASGLWACYRRLKAHKSFTGGVVLSSVLFASMIAPWLVRNYQTFGKFVFIRSNFGAELRLGNGPWAEGLWMQWLHPTQDVLEMRRYQQLGELEYVAVRKQEAVEWIKADYSRFLWVSMKRFIFYWAGLPRPGTNAVLASLRNSLFLASSILAFWGLGRAIRKRIQGAWLVFWLILSYSSVYYVVFPHPRYRHPIEPELLILIVYVISQAKIRRSAPAREPMSPFEAAGN